MPRLILCSAFLKCSDHGRGLTGFAVDQVVGVGDLTFTNCKVRRCLHSRSGLGRQTMGRHEHLTGVRDHLEWMGLTVVEHPIPNGVPIEPVQRSFPAGAPSETHAGQKP